MRVLTAEETQLALNVTTDAGGLGTEVVVSAFKINMTREMLSCLAGRNWLNDEVVNFYRGLMKERESNRMRTTGTPVEVLYMTSFFLAKLVSDEAGYQYSEVQRWTRNVDIFKLRCMIIPVHTINHWTLAVINFQAKTLAYYDSMGSDGRGILETLFQYIQDEHKDKHNATLPNPGEWRKVSPGNAVPQQQNGSDCGVFMIQFANYIAEQKDFDFLQADIPHLRSRMAVEIARRQLLPLGRVSFTGQPREPVSNTEGQHHNYCMESESNASSVSLSTSGLESNASSVSLSMAGLKSNASSVSLSVAVPESNASSVSLSVAVPESNAASVSLFMPGPESNASSVSLSTSGSDSSKDNDPGKKVHHRRHRRRRRRRRHPTQHQNSKNDDTMTNSEVASDDTMTNSAVASILGESSFASLKNYLLKQQKSVQRRQSGTHKWKCCYCDFCTEISWRSLDLHKKFCLCNPERTITSFEALLILQVHSKTNINRQPERRKAVFNQLHKAGYFKQTNYLRRVKVVLERHMKKKKKDRLRKKKSKRAPFAAQATNFYRKKLGIPNSGRKKRQHYTPVKTIRKVQLQLKLNRTLDPSHIRRRFFKNFKQFKRRININKERVREMEREMEALLVSLRRIPGWKAVWEALSHNADNGHSGTMCDRSLAQVLGTLAYLVKLSGLKTSAFSIIEAGCGVLDAQKALRIAFPQMNSFGYDLKNYFAGVFHDLHALGTAIRNLNAAVSAHTCIGLKSFGEFEYNFGVALNKAGNLKEKLKQLGASKRIYNSNNMIFFAFWEGWSPEHKIVAINCIRMSKVNIAFLADRTSKFPTEEKLAILNSNKPHWHQQFIAFRTLTVQMAAGNDRMQGVFFIRRSLIRNDLADYGIKDCLLSMRPPVDLTKSRWIDLWKRTKSKSSVITLAAMQYFIVMKTPYTCSGLPTRWHVMEFTHTHDADELKKIVSKAVGLYMDSNWFCSGGHKWAQMVLRSALTGMTAEEKSLYAKINAKANMMIVSRDDICKEFFEKIDIVQDVNERNDVIGTVLNVHNSFECAKCPFSGTSKSVFIHCENDNNCVSTLDDLVHSSSSVDEIEFATEQDECVQNVIGLFGKFQENLTSNQRKGLVDERTKADIVKDLIEIIEFEIKAMNEEKRIKELLNRWRANVTVAQQKILSRTQKKLVHWRFVNATWYVPVGNETYPIKMSELSTNLDSETAKEMLRESGIEHFLAQSETVLKDHAYVKEFGQLMLYRIKMAINHYMRKESYIHGGTLYITIHFDGAPRTKSGQQKDQLIVLVRILNENISQTREQMIPILIANVKEDSAEAHILCGQIAESMLSFQKDVARHKLETVRSDGTIDYHTDVAYIPACDMKALNKLFGFADHRSPFCYPSAVFMCKQNSGYGTIGRNSENPFSIFAARQLTLEELKVVFRKRKEALRKHEETYSVRKGRKKRRRATEVRPFSEENLPKPVQMTPEILQFLREEVKKTPETDRAAFAKSMGIGLVNPEPLFGSEVTWAMVALCALHYKTTKVADLLALCTNSLAMYDEHMGHKIADKKELGPSLDYFLKALHRPIFRSKLIVYAEKTEILFLKTAAKANFAIYSESRKHLESFLGKDDICSRRLIGEQANQVLIHVEELLRVLQEAIKVHKKTGKPKTEKGMQDIFSSIYLMGIYSRELVYYMSASTHGEDKETKAKELTEIAEGYRRAAAKLEFLQVYCFPDLFRPYDLIATTVGPDVMDKLVSHGFSLGEVGLLEVMESYHQYVKSLPVYRSIVSSSTNKSSCLSKLIKILLTHTYGEMVDPQPLKEIRAQYVHHKSNTLTRESKSSYIKTFHDYDGVGCICGRCIENEDCMYCSYANISALDQLIQDAVGFLANGNATAKDVKVMAKRVKQRTKYIFMKGITVSR